MSDELKAFVAKALLVEIIEQADGAWINPAASTHCIELEATLDAERLAEVALEARKRWHRRTAK